MGEAAKDPGDDRESFIVDCLVKAFSDLMEADPDAFRTKFRKMAADPFAFYRGSACVFYADVAAREDRWADERTSRVWIQGDLHAENFGTYMDGSGVLIFDVNDFDEAYVGHFTWDLQRFAASVALMCWQKALSDEEIAGLIETFVRAYIRAGSVVRRCRGRLDILAESRNRPRRGVVRPAHGTAVDQAGDAGPHDAGRRLRSAVPGSARRTPTRRRRTRQGRRRLRALPADDSGRPSASAGSPTTSRM